MEQKPEKSCNQFTRRDFLKTSALGVGATAMVGLNPNAAVARQDQCLKDNAFRNANPMPALSAPQKWDYKTDVLVVGGGGAGLAATVQARENKADVILIEKNAFCGGDTSIAMVWEGLCGSDLQKKLGVPIPPLSARVMSEGSTSPDNYMSITAPNATSGRDPALVRQIMAHQADSIHWCQKHGVVFSENPVGGLPMAGLCHCPIDPKHPEEDWYRWAVHNGRGFTEALEKSARNLGAKILMEHPAIGLIKQGRKVIGACAKAYDGKKVFIKAKAVILTTGGFAANKDMLKKYCAPHRAEAVRPWSMDSATGDGIRMAQSLGATLRNMEDIEIWDGGALREHGSTTVYSAPNQLVRQKSLTVNKKAKRFFNESLYRGYYYSYQAAQTIAQMDMESFTLFDANCITKEDIIKKFHPTFCEYPCPWFEEQFDKYLKEGVIKQANSIKELARMLDLDPTELQKTVNRYNDLCKKGVDEDFFKETHYMHPIAKAPFYAVGQKGGSCFNTWGGLVLDEKFRVLDEEWNAIPGLYVAGENAAGGSSISFVIPGGRLAADSATEEIRS